MPIRQSNARHHNHSVSVGSVSQSHRVTRRKSMSSNGGTNLAAVAAAVKDATDEAADILPALSNRRSMTLKVNAASSRAANAGGSVDVGNYPSPPSSLPNQGKHLERATRNSANADHGSAIVDGPGDDQRVPEADASSNKNRMRRASEGSHLVKTEGKRMSSGELRCDQCGKGYKHSSCLTKHLYVQRV